MVDKPTRQAEDEIDNKENGNKGCAFEDKGGKGLVGDGERRHAIIIPDGNHEINDQTAKR